jgi:hypothetical protein
MTTSTSSDVFEHVIGQTGELSLRLHAGDVDIHGVDADTVRIRDLDGRDLAERFTIEAADGRLAIRPRDRFMIDFGFSFGASRHGAGLAVEVPRGARLSIDTASADVHGTGLVGEQHYRTASGSIELDAAAGTIGIDAVSGDVDVRVDGEVGLSGRAVSGDVTIRGGRVRSLALSTTSGDVEVEAELAGQGPFAVQTVSGDVSIASSRGLQVQAKTLTGDIAGEVSQRSQPGPGKGLVTTGDGGTPFSFKSISGNLRVSHSGGPSAPRKGEPLSAEAEDHAAQRLAILRDLEAGTIDIEAASARLADLEDVR